MNEATSRKDPVTWTHYTRTATGRAKAWKGHQSHLDDLAARLEAHPGRDGQPCSQYEAEDYNGWLEYQSRLQAGIEWENSTTAEDRAEELCWLEGCAIETESLMAGSRCLPSERRISRDAFTR